MIKTTWGYTLTGVNKIPDFLTPAEFDAFTNRKFNGLLDTRVKANIPSATRAIQNYCGWHIYPNLECATEYRVADLRDYLVGHDLLIQLPATMVTAIKSLTIDGENITDFDLENDRAVRVYDCASFDKRSKLRVVFDAGVDASQMDLIKELVAHRITHAVSSSYGVMSEAAGGVSVTYNAAWAGNTRSTALPDDNKEILEPFKVKGVF